VNRHEDPYINRLLIRTFHAMRKAKDRAAGDHPCPYYELVPKGMHANLEFRRNVIQMGLEDEEFANGIKRMCARDLLFHVNLFAFTYDPRRPPETRMIPFITFRFQDDFLIQVRSAIGKNDMFCEKSRDMGASWMLLYAFEHIWHFEENSRLGVMSRTEDYVDAGPKSLLGKIDLMHEYMPKWMLPPHRQMGRKDPNRTALRIPNVENGSTIEGEATTENAWVGDRLQAILIDEYSKFTPRAGEEVARVTRDATLCRIFNGTPKGVGTPFHEMSRSEIPKVRLHWTDHPLKRQGLYELSDNELKIKDRIYWEAFIRKNGGNHEPDNLEEEARKFYDFDKVRWPEHFKARSPWFDNELKRAQRPVDIHQELEIKHDAAAEPFFELQDVENHIKRFGRHPNHVGELDYEQDSMEPDQFLEQKYGRLKLWFPYTEGMRPRLDYTYVVGVDIATGTRSSTGAGASNSVATVICRETRELVAQYVVNGMSPERFAERVYALGKWFTGRTGRGAYMIWEANGPGGIFGDFMVRKNYGNFYLRQDVNNISRKSSKKPGWFTGKENKNNLLGRFREAIGEEGTFVCRDIDTLRECEQYQYVPGEGVEHSAAVNTLDPSGARSNHGDRVIATALAWWVVSENLKLKEPGHTDIPPNSWAGRFKKRQLEHKEEPLWRM
jgi:hypothetical protein